MPTLLIYNSQVINSTNNDYIKIKIWLAEHTDKWQSSLASYGPVDVYTNTAEDKYFHINVGGKIVIINYQDENKNMHQVIRKKFND